MRAPEGRGRAAFTYTENATRNRPLPADALVEESRASPGALELLEQRQRRGSPAGAVPGADDGDAGAALLARLHAI